MDHTLRSRVPAGLVDSGTASIASFLAALIATWTLDAAGLGVYAVFFSAYLFGSFLPRNLVLLPVEIAAVAHPPGKRGPMVARSVRIGLGPSFVGVAAIGIAALASLRVAGSDLLVPMIVTAGITTFVAPLRDHVRRMLHLAGRSWHAAAASVAMLLTVVGAVVLVLIEAPLIVVIPAAWIPFGAFGLANIVSLAVAFVLAVRGHEAPEEDLTLRGLARTGGWLTVSGLSARAAVFAASALITNLVGAEVMGFAEAARLAAQPLMVLGFGLDDVLSPQAMEAGLRRDPDVARPSVRLYFGLVSVISLVYLVVASFDWPLNPMAYLVPLAYAVPGLAAVSVLAVVADIITYPYRAQLMGGRQERALARMDVVTSAAPIVLAFTAPITASFARALGSMAQGVLQFLWYRGPLGRMYRERVGSKEATVGD